MQEITLNMLEPTQNITEVKYRNVSPVKFCFVNTENPTALCCFMHMAIIYYKYKMRVTSFSV